MDGVYTVVYLGTKYQANRKPVKWDSMEEKRYLPTNNFSKTYFV